MPAGGAGAGWNQRGPTAGPPTGAATARPAPLARTRTAGNTYVREDQILPHLAALAILLAGHAGTPVRGSRGRAQLTGPDGTAALIDQLRADGTVLTYDPDGRTLRAGDHDAPAVTIGTDAAGTHSRQGKTRRTA